MLRKTSAAVVSSMMLIVCLACAQASGPTAAADGTTQDSVVARYGDVTITATEMQEMLGTSLLRLENQLYQAKVDALRGHLMERIIDDKASEQGLSRDEFIKVNVTDKVAEVPEAQIEQVMRQYRERLPADDAAARQQVVTALTQQQQRAVEQQFYERLFAESGASILLDPPRAEVPVEAYNPTAGIETAPVVLIEYTDFQCPYCSRVQPTLEQVKQRYGDNLLHVFKQLPLPMHKQAPLAAEASLCANDQGAFWVLHKWMFANAPSINRQTLEAEAEKAGIDVEAFKQCLDDKVHAAHVQADAKEANGLGISGTPGFLINGRVLSGAQPLANFIAVIDEELERKGIALPAEGSGEAE